MKDSACQRTPFGSPGLTILLSSPKIKRASRSLLRQVRKVSIPFDTVVKIQKINFLLSDPLLDPLVTAFQGPFGTPLGLHLGASGDPWDTFGSLWGFFGDPWGLVGLHFGPIWLQWGSFTTLVVLFWRPSGYLWGFF